MIFIFLTLPQARANNSVELENDTLRCEEFMDWGVGMFIHWSLDSELGSVISHSMVGASDDYLDRYIHELPKFFNPKNYDAEEWVKLAKLAGCKYMVLTSKHHSGFCLWPTKSTDFSIDNTSISSNPTALLPEGRWKSLSSIFQTNENYKSGTGLIEMLIDIRAKEGNLWFTQRNPGRKESGGNTRISVLGQNDRVLEYSPSAKPASRLQQTKNGLQISVVRAQRIYNDSKWPNPVVVKLEDVEFVSE